MNYKTYIAFSKSKDEDTATHFFTADTVAEMASWIEQEIAAGRHVDIQKPKVIKYNGPVIPHLPEKKNVGFYFLWDKNNRRKFLIAALKWFRETHPKYANVKTIHHGFYGWSVWAHYQFETTCVAQVEDVLWDFAKYVTEV